MYGGVTLETTSTSVADPHQDIGLPMQPRTGDIPKGGVLRFCGLPGSETGGLLVHNLPTERVRALEGYCHTHENCALAQALRGLYEHATANCTRNVIDAVVDSEAGRVGIWRPDGFREMSLNSTALATLRALA
jgi:hypothetical protein